MPKSFNDKYFKEKDGVPVLSTNDYLDRYNQQNPTVPSNQPSSNATEDYYQMAKNQEYDLLFDKDSVLKKFSSIVRVSFISIFIMLRFSLI